MYNVLNDLFIDIHKMLTVRVTELKHCFEIGREQAVYTQNRYKIICYRDFYYTNFLLNYYELWSGHVVLDIIYACVNIGYITNM